MANGVNKVIVVGHLGADPEVKVMPSGDAVANFNVATTESWTDKNSGEKKSETEWHRVVLFRRQAEVAGEYLKKGALVYIEGKLKTRKYRVEGEDRDRYVTEVEGRTMQMLGGKSDAGRAAAQGAPAQDPLDDDIPF